MNLVACWVFGMMALWYGFATLVYRLMGEHVIADRRLILGLLSWIAWWLMFREGER